MDSGEVERIVAAAAVLLHPARYEGFSLAIVEALVARDPGGGPADRRPTRSSAACAPSPPPRRRSPAAPTCSRDPDAWESLSRDGRRLHRAGARPRGAAARALPAVRREEPRVVSGAAGDHRAPVRQHPTGVPRDGDPLGLRPDRGRLGAAPAGRRLTARAGGAGLADPGLAGPAGHRPAEPGAGRAAQPGGRAGGGRRGLPDGRRRPDAPAAPRAHACPGSVAATSRWSAGAPTRSTPARRCSACSTRVGCRPAAPASWRATRSPTRPWRPRAGGSWTTRYDESLKRSEDKDLWLRASAHSTFAKTEEVLLFYRLADLTAAKQARDARYDRRLLRRHGPDLVGAPAHRREGSPASHAKQAAFAGLTRLGRQSVILRRKVTPLTPRAAGRGPHRAPGRPLRRAVPGWSDVRRAPGADLPPRARGWRCCPPG